MAKKQGHTPRKPATKFAHLRKNMQQRKIEASLSGKEASDDSTDPP